MPGVPRDEQFAAIRRLIGIDDIEAARAVFPLATVQNRYDLANRDSEVVVEHCTANGIGFIPWFPLAGGRLTGPGSILQRIAIAWLLRRSPAILPIPGTTSIAHLEENALALDLMLRDDEFTRLDEAGGHV